MQPTLWVSSDCVLALLLGPRFLLVCALHYPLSPKIKQYPQLVSHRGAKTSLTEKNETQDAPYILVAIPTYKQLCLFFSELTTAHNIKVITLHTLLQPKTLSVKEP